MSCDEQEMSDMDGEVIKTDNFIFCDETTATAKVPESALNETQSVVVEQLLCKYAEVFEEKPAGSARVEPMVVRMKEGWSPPPMEPYRNYPPRVEEAIKKDMEKQQRTGVIEESDADKGCPVHMVPKPDSDSGYRFCVDFRARNTGGRGGPLSFADGGVDLGVVVGLQVLCKDGPEKRVLAIPSGGEVQAVVSLHALGKDVAVSCGADGLHGVVVLYATDDVWLIRGSVRSWSANLSG